MSSPAYQNEDFNSPKKQPHELLQAHVLFFFKLKLSTLFKNVFPYWRTTFIFYYPVTSQMCEWLCWLMKWNAILKLSSIIMGISHFSASTLTLQVLRSNLCLLIPSIKGRGNHLKHENLDSALIQLDPGVCLILIGFSPHPCHTQWPSFSFNFMSHCVPGQEIKASAYAVVTCNGGH